jgi:uncharacterized repeat protein (TIGR03803 family)
MNTRPILGGLNFRAAFRRKTLGRHSGWRTALPMLLVWAASVIASPAQTFTTLANFDAAHGDDSTGNLFQGSGGNFYGTTEGGGVGGSGTAFKITPQGALTTLHSFCSQPGCPDGKNPDPGLVAGSDGNLYGTTDAGGIGSSGTIFKITPKGTLTTLYSFCSQPTACLDGAVPVGLMLGMNGSLYGTTLRGGSSNYGTVFSLSAGLFNSPAMGEQVDYFGEGKADFTVW